MVPAKDSAPVNNRGRWFKSNTYRHPTLFIAFNILSILDGGLTYIGVQRFGIFVEANPLIRWSMGAIGIVPALVGFKAASMLGVGWMYFTAPPEQKRHVFWVLTLTVIVLMLVCVIPWIGILWWWE